MTTPNSEIQSITSLSGVQPATDMTAAATRHWVAADRVRFKDGLPWKIGGHREFDFQDLSAVDGVPRTLFSAAILNSVKSVIGTHKKLYSLSGQRITNITPLLTTTIAVANSLQTHYATLANNPITTINGSSDITVADADAARYAAGDVYTLSGASAVGGITAGQINTDHIVISIGSGSLVVRTGGTASSAATGGGASVVRASGLIRITHAAHGQANGDRVKITDAGDAGGILAASINKQFLIRNVTTNTFDVFTEGTATSSVSAAGGANTKYQKEIDDGASNESAGQGYGVGLYGTGLYGVSGISSNGRRYPRIWFIDRFAETLVMTPGNQGGLYYWDGTTTTAPVLQSGTGVPAAINYAFVSNSIVVTFGEGNVPNRIVAGAQGSPTTWVSSSTNTVYADNIEGAGRLISHAPAPGVNLIFTENQTYTFRFIDRPLVWDIKLLSGNIGLIAPMARIVVNGIPYWMGQKNFYRWYGGKVEVIPSNSSPESTILNYVFTNINQGQKSKIFAHYNELFNEIEWHYPSSESNEPNRIARLCLTDFSWTTDTIGRTCAEYPDTLLVNPRKMSSDGKLYIHETGNDNNGSAMEFSLTSSKILRGKETTHLTTIIPDSSQTGNITLRVYGYLYPQSTTPIYNKTYTITPTTEKVTVDIDARYLQYQITGSALGQYWRAGQWLQTHSRGSNL